MRQLLSGRKATPLITARSGATGGPGCSKGGKKAKFSQIAQSESRKSHWRTATRYQINWACTMLSGIDSSSKKGEKSSQTSTCSSRRLSMVCSFRRSGSLATFPRPQFSRVDWRPCRCQRVYHTILNCKPQASIFIGLLETWGEAYPARLLRNSPQIYNKVRAQALTLLFRVRTLQLKS